MILVFLPFVQCCLHYLEPDTCKNIIGTQQLKTIYIVDKMDLKVGLKEQGVGIKVVQ